MAEETHPRRARPLATLALLVVSAGLAFLLAEAAARWLTPTGGGKEGAEGQRYTAYDPLLGWHKVPGARATYRRREYQVEVVVNSRGLRDPERAYDPPPGRVRPGGNELPGRGDQRRHAGLQRRPRVPVLPSEGRRYHPRPVLLFLYYDAGLPGCARGPYVPVRANLQLCVWRAPSCGLSQPVFYPPNAT